MSSSPLIYVNLIYTPEPDSHKEQHPDSRWQPWTCQVTNGGNSKPLLKSTEPYTNRQDLLDMIASTFGPASNVYVREAGKGNVALRLANAEHAGSHVNLDDDPS